MQSFASRRQALLSKLSGPALLVAAPIAVRNYDVEYPYRQDSDFYYLTGFLEPESACLLVPGAHPKFVLFVRPRDPEREVWNGPRAGLDGARADFRADESHSIDELETVLARELEGWDHLWFAFGKDPAWDRRIPELINKQRARRKSHPHGPYTVSDLAEPLQELRLRKSAHELETLRRAAEITAIGHREAMQMCRPGLHEYELAARLDYAFARHGLSWGYPGIVGSGPNATVLHHVENRRRIDADDLVLIDAGAECELMTADVTRTFPASGRFTAAQRELYDIVLAAQEASIEECRVGRTFGDVHDASVRVLIEGMIRVGLLEGEPEAIFEGGSYRRYYMHRTSHWLGLDVHDAGKYKLDGEWRPLEPSMVLTVEPGLYVSRNDEEAPARFRGLGIRIEDDVAVTAGAPEVLTAAIPKVPEEIEREVGRAARGAEVLP